MEFNFNKSSVPTHINGCKYMSVLVERIEGGILQSKICKHYGIATCLLPSVHTNTRLNTNKIRARCALLARTSVGSEPRWKLAMRWTGSLWPVIFYTCRAAYVPSSINTTRSSFLHMLIYHSFFQFTLHFYISSGIVLPLHTYKVCAFLCMLLVAWI